MIHGRRQHKTVDLDMTWKTPPDLMQQGLGCAFCRQAGGNAGGWVRSTNASFEIAQQLRRIAVGKTRIQHLPSHQRAWVIGPVAPDQTRDLALLEADRLKRQ